MIQQCTCCADGSEWLDTLMLLEQEWSRGCDEDGGESNVLFSSFCTWRRSWWYDSGGTMFGAVLLTTEEQVLCDDGP